MGQVPDLPRSWGWESGDLGAPHCQSRFTSRLDPQGHSVPAAPPPVADFREFSPDSETPLPLPAGPGFPRSSSCRPLPVTLETTGWGRDLRERA